jgi:hypothetical protein
MVIAIIIIGLIAWIWCMAVQTKDQQKKDEEAAYENHIKKIKRAEEKWYEENLMDPKVKEYKKQFEEIEDDYL